MKKALFIMIVCLLSCNSLWPSEEADLKETAIESAIKSGSLDDVEELIKQNIDLRELTSRGQAPLTLAAIWKGGSVPITQALLRRGADIDQPDKYGKTPLMGASGNFRLPLTQLLLDEGANPIIESEGITALDFLVKSQHGEAVSIRNLLRKGRDEWLIKQLKDGTLPPEVLNEVSIRNALREGRDNLIKQLKERTLSDDILDSMYQPLRKAQREGRLTN